MTLDTLESVNVTENILDLAPDEALARLREWVTQRGEPSYRAEQVFARLWEKPVNSFADMTELPKGLRAALAEHFTMPRLSLVERRLSTDGTQKFLFQLNDGQDDRNRLDSG